MSNVVLIPNVEAKTGESLRLPTPQLPDVLERDFDRMMRQFRAAKWGLKGDDNPLHPRLRSFVARYDSLFLLEDALLKAAVGLVRGWDSDVRWTAVTEWLYRYAVRRVTRAVDSGKGKHDLAGFYDPPEKRRQIDQRIARVNESLIRELHINCRQPAVEPERIVGPRMDRSRPSFNTASIRALGDVLHGNDAEEEAVHTLIIERILAPEDRWKDKELDKGERDGAAGLEVLTPREKRAAQDYLANPSRQHVRNSMEQLIGFHQQDADLDPNRRVLRWPAPPPYADDGNPLPRYGASGRRLVDFEVAIAKLLPSRSEVQRAEIARAVYDHSGEYVDYVAILSKAIEAYHEPAIKSVSTSPFDDSIEPSAFDLSVGVERGLLRKKDPASDHASARALAYLDVARGNVLLSSGDPRTLQYGQRALDMLGVSERDADRSDKIGQEEFDQAIRALRHNASLYRKRNWLRQAEDVHERMRTMLCAHLGQRAEAYRVRNHAIHLVHESAIPLINHRNTVFQTGRLMSDGDFEEISKIDRKAQKLLAWLNDIARADKKFGVEASVTMSSLLRRRVELAALAVRTGRRERWDRLDRVWNLVESEMTAAEDSGMRALLAARAGMYLVIGCQSWEKFDELDTYAKRCQGTVSPDALVHSQLDELRRRKILLRRGKV